MILVSWIWREEVDCTQNTGQSYLNSEKMRQIDPKSNIISKIWENGARTVWKYNSGWCWFLLFVGSFSSF